MSNDDQSTLEPIGVVHTPYETAEDALHQGFADDNLYNLVVGEEELPESVRHADAILHVELKDEELAKVQYDEGETETRKEQVQDRFDKLSKRPPRDDNSDPSC